MKPFNWNDEKNEKLKLERGLSFEDVSMTVYLDGYEVRGVIEKWFVEKRNIQKDVNRFCFFNPKLTSKDPPDPKYLF